MKQVQTELTLTTRGRGCQMITRPISEWLALTQLSIPVVDGRMALGTWQGIHRFEHRHAAHARRLVLHLIGE